MSLPQGKGRKFRDQMDDLLPRTREELSRAFSSEEYNRQKQKMLEEGQAEQQRVIEGIAKEAQEQGFALQMTPVGPMLIPMLDGRPMEEREYFALKESDRKALEAKQTELRRKLRDSFERVSNKQRETAERMQKADKDIGEYTVSRIFTPMFEGYRDIEKITLFLNELKKYTLDNLDLFKTKEEPVHPMFGVPVSQVMGGRAPFLPFQINVFIDNSETKGPPVIIESNPNFGNMFGKIERRFLFGGYLSDHMSLKPGALSMADGGYLLVSARDVLMNPGVWPALKRAIKNREVRVEDPFEQFGLIATQGIKLEPMPIKVKIALIGDAYLYQLLAMYDEDFWEIFKVKADFNFELEKTEENMMHYAAFLSGCCEECEARHFDPTGVARVLEYSTRMVSDQERLSSRFAQIKELIEEANYWANRENAKYISAGHVQKALDEKLFRHDLLDERIRDYDKA